MRDRALVAAFVVLSLIVVGTVRAQENPADGGSSLVTLSLSDASLDDALDALFQDSPYSFNIEAGVSGTPSPLPAG